jgi:hypothetical protein
MAEVVEHSVAAELTSPADEQRIEERGGEEGGEGGVPEEGEIVSAETQQLNRQTEAAPKKHPLEHPWTFWFDNPNGKQKQATWGSSIRAVYTFSTVEDFWWYVLFSQFLFVSSSFFLVGFLDPFSLLFSMRLFAQYPSVLVSSVLI